MGNFSAGRSCTNKLGNGKGQQAEQFACYYLQQQGLKLITRNFRVKSGEIDLIMREKNILVFVEVRYRASEKFGGALASIDWHKQQRIITTAKWFLQQHQIMTKFICRFDVVTVSGTLSVPKIEWLKDAFQ